MPMSFAAACPARITEIVNDPTLLTTIPISECTGGTQVFG
jgi:hypothetical protein